MTPATHSTTIEDVARLAGVSRAAVSKVIRDAYGVSPQMKTKVQSAIDQLGYRPRIGARAMRGASYTLGVEVPDINNAFFPKIINGATAALADTRYQLILAPAGSEENVGSDAIDALVDHQVDGIISIGPRVSQQYLEMVARHTPLVMIGNHCDTAAFDTLASDDWVGAQMAVRHLYDLGHRRILHLTLPEPRPGLVAPGNPHGMRLESYRATMAELGLTAELIYIESDQESYRATMAELGLTAELIQTESDQELAHVAACQWLTTTSGPVGIFAAHDELALGVLRAVRKLGLTPGQVSVVGYDDIAIADHPMISLTTINQSGTQMGSMAVRLLLEHIAGRREHAHEVLPPRLRVRESSAAPEPRPAAS